MKTKLKITAAIAFAVLFVGKSFAQEWEHSIEYSMNDDECFELYDAFEMTNGLAPEKHRKSDSSYNFEFCFHSIIVLSTSHFRLPSRWR